VNIIRRLYQCKITPQPLLTFYLQYAKYAIAHALRHELYQLIGVVKMAKDKQRQALALSARLSSRAINLPGFPGRALTALGEEAARIVAEDAEKRLNGGTSLHLVAS
jgi:hypothetical protein